ncbi:RDD family protein [Mycoplasma seminis]|uniref:RDD family protein n=1 Tax=Mycoplasma seminis TaxID=512749 RepID=A0ABY9HB75_9MOLU|nr:RDD family protein [Mycoplasma seminis]WLP85854.1 RDD family protein [Mycoplasma seminis]
MYKNAGFFKRFFSNLIDFVLVVAFIFAIAALVHWKYYQTLGISLIWINCYYILFPLIWKGKTIGMLILNLKVINSADKKFHYYLIFKRNVLGCFFITLNVVIILIAAGIMQKKLGNSLDEQTIKSTLSGQVLTGILTAFMGTWFIIQTLGYFMLIFSKRKLTLLDISFNSRIVEDKYLELIEEKDIILLPYYYTERKFRYFEQGE